MLPEPGRRLRPAGERVRQPRGAARRPARAGRRRPSGSSRACRPATRSWRPPRDRRGAGAGGLVEAERSTVTSSPRAGSEDDEHRAEVEAETRKARRAPAAAGRRRRERPGPVEAGRADRVPGRAAPSSTGWTRTSSSGWLDAVRPGPGHGRPRSPAARRSPAVLRRRPSRTPRATPIDLDALFGARRGARTDRGRAGRRRGRRRRDGPPSVVPAATTSRPTSERARRGLRADRSADPGR